MQISRGMRAPGAFWDREWLLVAKQRTEGAVGAGKEQGSVLVTPGAGEEPTGRRESGRERGRRPVLSCQKGRWLRQPGGEGRGREATETIVRTRKVGMRGPSRGQGMRALGVEARVGDEEAGGLPRGLEGQD